MAGGPGARENPGRKGTEQVKFTLEIELGNDAMQTPFDVSIALAALGARFAARENWGAPTGQTDAGTLRDRNGNTVGRWQVVD